MSLNIFSCKKQQENYYCFGTNDYFEKEKSLKINTEEAALLFSKKYFLENPNQDNVTVNLDVIYGDYYIFSNKLIL